MFTHNTICLQDNNKHSYALKIKSLQNLRGRAEYPEIDSTLFDFGE